MKRLSDFINEATNEDKGCAMLYFDFPDMNKIHNMIEGEDIYDDETEKYGLETEPHCTILYGFHCGSTDGNKVIEMLKSSNIPSELKLENASLFENEFDVLKFDVVGDGLAEMNKLMTDNFEYSSDYPDYHPHCTIAYLKKGMGKKYVEKLKDQVFSIKPELIVYSDSKRNKTKEKL